MAYYSRSSPRLNEGERGDAARAAPYLEDKYNDFGEYADAEVRLCSYYGPCHDCTDRLVRNSPNLFTCGSYYPSPHFPDDGRGSDNWSDENEHDDIWAHRYGTHEPCPHNGEEFRNSAMNPYDFERDVGSPDEFARSRPDSPPHYGCWAGLESEEGIREGNSGTLTSRTFSKASEYRHGMCEPYLSVTDIVTVQNDITDERSASPSEYRYVMHEPYLSVTDIVTLQNDITDERSASPSEYRYVMHEPYLSVTDLVTLQNDITDERSASPSEYRYVMHEPYLSVTDLVTLQNDITDERSASPSEYRYVMHEPYLSVTDLVTLQNDITDERSASPSEYRYVMHEPYLSSATDLVTLQSDITKQRSASPSVYADPEPFGYKKGEMPSDEDLQPDLSLSGKRRDEKKFQPLPSTSGNAYRNNHLYEEERYDKHSLLGRGILHSPTNSFDYEPPLVKHVHEDGCSEDSDDALSVCCETCGHISHCAKKSDNQSMSDSNLSSDFSGHGYEADDSSDEEECDTIWPFCQNWFSHNRREMDTAHTIDGSNSDASYHATLVKEIIDDNSTRPSARVVPVPEPYLNEKGSKQKDENLQPDMIIYGKQSNETGFQHLSPAARNVYRNIFLCGEEQNGRHSDTLFGRGHSISCFEDNPLHITRVLKGDKQESKMDTCRTKTATLRLLVKFSEEETVSMPFKEKEEEKEADKVCDRGPETLPYSLQDISQYTNVCMEDSDDALSVGLCSYPETCYDIHHSAGTLEYMSMCDVHSIVFSGFLDDEHEGGHLSDEEDNSGVWSFCYTTASQNRHEMDTAHTMDESYSDASCRNSWASHNRREMDNALTLMNDANSDASYHATLVKEIIDDSSARLSARVVPDPLPNENGVKRTDLQPDPFISGEEIAETAFQHLPTTSGNAYRNNFLFSEEHNGGNSDTLYEGGFSLSSKDFFERNPSCIPTESNDDTEEPNTGTYQTLDEKEDVPVSDEEEVDDFRSPFKRMTLDHHQKEAEGSAPKSRETEESTFGNRYQEGLATRPLAVLGDEEATEHRTIADGKDGQEIKEGIIDGSRNKSSNRKFTRTFKSEAGVDIVSAKDEYHSDASEKLPSRDTVTGEKPASTLSEMISGTFETARGLKSDPENLQPDWHNKNDCFENSSIDIPKESNGDGDETNIASHQARAKAFRRQEQMAQEDTVQMLVDGDGDMSLWSFTTDKELADYERSCLDCDIMTRGEDLNNHRTQSPKKSNCSTTNKTHHFVGERFDNNHESASKVTIKNSSKCEASNVDIQHRDEVTTLRLSLGNMLIKQKARKQLDLNKLFLCIYGYSIPEDEEKDKHSHSRQSEGEYDSEDEDEYLLLHQKKDKNSAKTGIPRSTSLHQERGSFVHQQGKEETSFASDDLESNYTLPSADQCHRVAEPGIYMQDNNENLGQGQQATHEPADVTENPGNVSVGDFRVGHNEYTGKSKQNAVLLKVPDENHICTNERNGDESCQDKSDTFHGTRLKQALSEILHHVHQIENVEELASASRITAGIRDASLVPDLSHETDPDDRTFSAQQIADDINEAQNGCDQTFLCGGALLEAQPSPLSTNGLLATNVTETKPSASDENPKDGIVSFTCADDYSAGHNQEATETSLFSSLQQLEHGFIACAEHNVDIDAQTDAVYPNDHHEHTVLRNNPTRTQAEREDAYKKGLISTDSIGDHEFQSTRRNLDSDISNVELDQHKGEDDGTSEQGQYCMHVEVVPIEHTGSMSETDFESTCKHTESANHVSFDVQRQGQWENYPKPGHGAQVNTISVAEVTSTKKHKPTFPPWYNPSDAAYNDENIEGPQNEDKDSPEHVERPFPSHQLQQPPRIASREVETPSAVIRDLAGRRARDERQLSHRNIASASPEPQEIVRRDGETPIAFIRDDLVEQGTCGTRRLPHRRISSASLQLPGTQGIAGRDGETPSTIICHDLVEHRVRDERRRPQFRIPSALLSQPEPQGRVAEPGRVVIEHGARGERRLPHRRTPSALLQQLEPQGIAGRVIIEHGARGERRLPHRRIPSALLPQSARQGIAGRVAEPGRVIIEHGARGERRLPHRRIPSALLPQSARQGIAGRVAEPGRVIIEHGARGERRLPHRRIPHTAHPCCCHQCLLIHPRTTLELLAVSVPFPELCQENDERYGNSGDYLTKGRGGR